MSARRRFLITVVAVPAILVGLLAMHFLASADEASPTTTMTMSTGTEPTASAPTAGSSHPDCGAVCLGSSAMTMTMTMSMTCVLALLVTTIILAVLSAIARRDPELLHRLVTLWRGRIASLPPPLPPSLHVLSISRT